MFQGFGYQTPGQSAFQQSFYFHRYMHFVATSDELMSQNRHTLSKRKLVIFEYDNRMSYDLICAYVWCFAIEFIGAFECIRHMVGIVSLIDIHRGHIQWRQTGQTHKWSVNFFTWTRKPESKWLCRKSGNPRTSCWIHQFHCNECESSCKTYPVHRYWWTSVCARIDTMVFAGKPRQFGSIASNFSRTLSCLSYQNHQNYQSHQHKPTPPPPTYTPHTHTHKFVQLYYICLFESMRNLLAYLVFHSVWRSLCNRFWPQLSIQT